MKKILFILFGAPGSGKGYLGECIKRELVRLHIASEKEIGYISTGDLLRAEIASQSPLGLEISQIVTSGKLVSDEIVDALVNKALQGKEKVKFLDGYPRTEKQFASLRAMLEQQKYRIISVKRDTPVSLILERVSKRRVCKNCKATHSVDDGKCPKCGGASVIRKDDAVIESRLAEYEKNTAGLWSAFESLSDVTFVVDGAKEAEEAAAYIVRM